MSVTMCVFPLSTARDREHVPGPVAGGLRQSLLAAGEFSWVTGELRGEEPEAAGAGGEEEGCVLGPPCPYRPLPPGLRPDQSQSLRGEHVCRRLLPPVGLAPADHPEGPHCPAR